MSEPVTFDLEKFRALLDDDEYGEAETEKLVRYARSCAAAAAPEPGGSRGPVNVTLRTDGVEATLLSILLMTASLFDRVGSIEKSMVALNDALEGHAPKGERRG